MAVIDPAGNGSNDLKYATYLGGTNDDRATGVAVDGAGRAYVTGYAQAGFTPVTTTAEGADKTYNNNWDVFVVKVNSAAQGFASVEYGTYLGGTGSESPGTGNAIAVDGWGVAYIVGSTMSEASGGSPFPITPETALFPVRPNSGSGLYGDAFMICLAPDGNAVLYGSYFGGNANDSSNAVVPRAPGWLLVAGSTTSSSASFPTTTGVYSRTRMGQADAFVYSLAIAPLLDESILTLCLQKGMLAGDSRSCCLFCGDDGNLYLVGDPVNTRTGAVDYTAVDLSFPALGGQMAFQRSYSSSPLAVDVYTETLGSGWTHNHDIRLIMETQPGGLTDTVKFKGQGASRYIFYKNVLTDTFTAYPGLQAELAKTASGYALTTTQQMVYTFDDLGLVQTWSDGKGHTWTYTYDDDERLARVADDSGARYLDFHYALSSTRLISVTDPLTRAVAFGYDVTSGDLISVTYPDGAHAPLTWTYTYTSGHRLTGSYDPGGHLVQGIGYDAQGRVITESNGLTQTLAIDYQGAATGAIAGTRVITHALGGAVGRPVTVTYDVRGTLIKLQDSQAYSSTKLFNGAFRPERIADQNGHATEAAWSAGGADLLQTVDALGHATVMGYDVSHNLTQTVQAGLVTTTFTYSGTLLTGRASLLDHRPVGSHYGYDASGLLITATDPLSRETAFGYDALGQRVVMTDALGHETHYAYDAVGRLITTTDALGRVTVNTYAPDDARDLLIQVTRNYTTTQAPPTQYNLVTRYAYDVRGQQVLVTDTLGHVTRTEYDLAGRPVTVTQNYSASLPLRHLGLYNLLTVTEYDVAGRPVDVIRNYVNGAYDRGHTDEDLRTRTEYDAQGRAVAQVQNYVNGSWDPGYTDEDVRTTTGYDAVGNVITQTDALGHVTRTWYDAVNRPVSVTQNYTTTPGVDPNQYNLTTWYGYDDLGRVVTQTDTGLRVTLTEYDDLGRVVTVTQNYTTTTTEPNYLDQYNLITRTGYDDAGNVVTRTDVLDHVTRTEYDALNRPVTVTQNYTTTTTAPNYLNQYNLVTVTGYDTLGQRVAVTDTLGRVTQYGHDALGRVVTVTRYLTSTPVLQLTHYDALGRRLETLDALGHRTQYGYDALGRTTIVTDATGYTRTTTYNALGRVTAQYDGLGRATTFTYDGLGRQLSVTDPLTHTTSYSYDAQGHRLTLTGADSVVTHYGYDALGRRVHVTENYMPDEDPDEDTNVVTRYVYNALGNPTAMVSSRGYTTTYT